jgi:ribosome maturation factor RimP
VRGAPRSCFGPAEAVAIPVRTQDISDLIGDVVAREGAELVDFEYSGSTRRPVLRAYVHIPGGTTVEACAELSRKIEARLDASELVGDRYTLEVSSPGLDRPLRARRDFERQRGHAITVRTTRPFAGRVELVGVLEEVGGETDDEFWIVLRPDAGGEPQRLGAEEIAAARPHIRW